jgi:hypothetical protein
LSKLPFHLFKLCKNSKPCLNITAFNVPRYLWEIQLADTYGLFTLGDGNIGRVCMERPTIKGTKMTICPFSIQPWGCSKAIKEL